MPRLVHNIPRPGERVVMTSTDEEGREGTVSSYDWTRSLLFVDLDDQAVPFRPGYTIGCGLSEVAALGRTVEAGDRTLSTKGQRDA